MTAKKIMAAVLSIWLTAGGMALAQELPDKKSMMFYGDQPVFTLETQTYPLAVQPYTYHGNLYFPVDDVLKACGFTLGWDEEKRAVIAEKDGVCTLLMTREKQMQVGDVVYPLEEGILYQEDTACMNLMMFSKMCGYHVYLTGTPPEYSAGKRDTLQDTVVGDTFRLPGQNVSTYAGITVVDGMGMELLSISEERAVRYAQTVNTLAQSLPDAVNVYSVLVPTACEFYAPKNLYTNQTSGIRRAYENLAERVTPVNVVKPLQEHGGEKIYFSTDHHWTQRGAYYAYQALMEVKGVQVPALCAFPTDHYSRHVGSFAGFMAGTAGQGIMRSRPELLERFLPAVSCEGAAYRDMYMKKFRYPVQAVDQRSTTYSSFIGGDNPLTVLVSGTKNGKKLLLLKDSYGTAFATWALNNYEEIYIADPRYFNGFRGNSEPFHLKDFYQFVPFDDLVILNYPGSAGAQDICQALLNMA